MYTVGVTVDDVIDAVAAFLTPFIGNAEIVRAQVNRVPMPPTPCVVLTELLSIDLETSSRYLDSVTQMITITSPTQIDVQVDFYGPDAGDQCRAVKSILRSTYAASMFPDGIKPLYSSDGIQAPLITGEQQWQARWTATLSLQYNPSLVIPAESALDLAISANPPSDL